MQSIDDDAIATSVAATGEGLAGTPLFLEETEARRAEKKIGDRPLSSSQGLGLVSNTKQCNPLS